MANIVSSKSFSITNVIKDFTSSIMQAIKTLGEDSEDNIEKDLELQVKEIEKQESNYIKELENQMNTKGDAKKFSSKNKKRLVPTKTPVITKHREVNGKEEKRV